MLHQGLEQTKAQGYPAVRAILKNSYGEKVDGIEDAKITAVDLGARSYGFVIKLPATSSSTEKELFLKIQIPFHSAKSSKLEKEEAEIQQQTFEFMEFSHDKMAVPKVLRSKDDDFVPHVVADAQTPQDLHGFELVLMTKALGLAVPFSAKGEEELRKFVEKKPGKSTGNLLRDDANYTGLDIRRMASAIADMHNVGERFLKENKVPIHPTHGMRPRDEIYADLKKALGFDAVEIAEAEIPSKISALKEEINQKALAALRAIPWINKEVTNPWQSGAKPQDLIREAKAKFLNSLSPAAQEKYRDKGFDLPFSIGMEEAIRGNSLTPKQIILGRQIQQIEELLLFAEGDKISQTAAMARNLSEVYKGVEALPQTVLHNDTNASNFLLDPQTGKMTLIDYDTLGLGPRIADLMTHHAGSEKIAKAVISAYDEKNPLTLAETKFGPHVVACLTFDKLAAALGNFSNTEKMNDLDHLNSLGWGIDMAYNNAKGWNQKEKVDLARITKEVRAEISEIVGTMRALDLAVTTGQVGANHDPLKTESGKVFGEEGSKKINSAVNESWVKRVGDSEGAEKTHAEKMKGKSKNGSNEIY